MESLVIGRGFWCGKKVLVTGHTGFKGSWLSLWLSHLGANVIGYSLENNNDGSIFNAANVKNRLYANYYHDIRDFSSLKSVIEKESPQVVFHLAAQSLVRKSYEDPLATFEVNVMGTANLLECVRHSPSVEVCVVVTTDKCYENNEGVDAPSFDESMKLGGHDPYSSSKACAELVSASYRRSFLGPCKDRADIGLATVRAGNVIGGGDVALDRLVPDVLTNLENGLEPVIRNPNSVRPWQYVLDPLAGYLMLAEKLSVDRDRYSEAWNFGPLEEAEVSVGHLVSELTNAWGADYSWRQCPNDNPHEAKTLRLNSEKAISELGWIPSRYTMSGTVKEIVNWQKAFNSGVDMAEFSMAQLLAYEGSFNSGDCR